MMQPTAARLDASHVPEINGATRNIGPVDRAIMHRIQLKINSQMPELALAHKQGRLTPQQHDRVNRRIIWGSFGLWTDRYIYQMTQLIKSMYMSMLREAADRDTTTQTAQGGPSNGHSVSKRVFIADWVHTHKLYLPTGIPCTQYTSVQSG